MNIVTYDERKAIYEMALQKWGEYAQVMMAIEEMSELTKEICKVYRGQGNIDNIAEEIADVTIMMEQLRLIYDINDNVCDQMDIKIRRLHDRLLEV
jgi:NTP pyrophosphatase (non-canonical NTP hydrolase)